MTKPMAGTPASRFIETLAAKQNTEVAKIVGKMMESYPLTAEVKKAAHGLSDDKNFSAFVARKPDRPKFRQAYEYLYASTNVSSLIPSWLLLVYDSDLPWAETMPAYQIVDQARPLDFMPKLALLLHPLKTKTDTQQAVHILKRAYDCATSVLERNLCVFMVPVLAMQMTKVAESEQSLNELSRWLDYLEVHEKPERLPILAEIYSPKFFVKFASRDFLKAADLIQYTSSQAMRPILFVMAGKRPEARQAIAELRKDATLTADDRKLLDNTSAILDGLEAKPKQ